jgi:hypothetical protein
VIGGCKTSRKYAGCATSSFFAKYSFENGSATLRLDFQMLTFVSNRGTLKKSWRNEGEMTCMHVFMVSSWCVAFWHAFVSYCTGSEHTIFPPQNGEVSQT